METIYFQDLEIDWSKAAKEFLFVEFKDLKELNKSSFLYKNQLEQLVFWVNYYSNLQCNDTNNSKDSKVNNIFSIVGERGTGKSSFVKSAVDLFENNKHQNNSFVYTLPTIDPTIFNGKLNILELFISMLKNEIDCNAESSRDNEYFNLVTKFNKTVKASVETLKNMRIKDSSFAEKNSSIEVLENIQKQQYFSDTIAELLKLFLELKSLNNKQYKFICLSIDDLDLVPNEFAYETVQLLEKFLNHQPNLYTLVALRREQLVNSVLSELISENRNLLDKDLLDHSEISVEELRSQAINLIDKVLPLPQQVTLEFKLELGINDLLSPFIENKEEKNRAIQLFNRYKEGDEKELSFQSFIQKTIMEQTRIQIEPIEKIEITRYNYPNNLRGALQYLEFIYQFENYQKEIDKSENIDISESIKLLKQNVMRYREYVVGTFKDNLSIELYDIISGWYGHEVEVRNSYLCNKLVFTLAKENEIDNFNKIIEKKSTNISLGDVYTVLSFLREQHRESSDIQYLLYAIKMLYSLEMLELLLKSIILSKGQVNGINHYFLQQYLCLARGKIMPDGFPYNGSFISAKNAVSYPYGVADEENKKRIINKILYSSISAYGDIRKLSKRELQNLSQDEIQKILQDDVQNLSQEDIQNLLKELLQKGFLENYWQSQIYRSRNEFEKSKFTKGTNYYIDLFAQLTDFERIEEKLIETFKEQKVPYLFYSVFDLDFFTKKNYTRGSNYKKSEQLDYSLKRVNDCFNNQDLFTADERKFRRTMVLPLLHQTHDTSGKVALFSPLFKNDEIELLKEIVTHTEKDNSRKEKLSSIDYDSLRSDAISAINSPYVGPKRYFARDYYKKIGNWPKNMSDHQKRRMTNFINKDRSQIFAELNDNLKLMNETINGYRSQFGRKQQEEE